MKGYIMVVEDSSDEREALQLTLEMRGYSVVALADGQSALAYLRQTEQLPYLISLDLMMRGTNGWEFRNAQLGDSRLAAIPVVICSGDGRLAEKGFALGLTEQLDKPIERAELFAIVARHDAH